MQIRFVCAAVLIATFAVTSLVTAARSEAPQQARGWTLGEDADSKVNPLPRDEKTITAGKALFKTTCTRCHGPGGLGDGEDADPDATDMDLTNPKRAERNTDGVVYYKILNGRGRPKMPAFKGELTEEQIWTLVTYVQTLRKKG